MPFNLVKLLYSNSIIFVSIYRNYVTLMCYGRYGSLNIKKLKSVLGLVRNSYKAL